MRTLFAIVAVVLLVVGGPASFASTHGRRVDVPPVVRFAVAVDVDAGSSTGTTIDAAEALSIVAETLQDDRSWGPIVGAEFEPTTWRSARLRIRIRSPRNTDRSCAPFRTGGVKSCSRNWEVFINALRWTRGATPSGMDLTAYRQYVVNHEVGHSLGRGHVPCTQTGAIASVMQQQTIGLDGCTPNPWPNPGAST